MVHFSTSDETDCTFPQEGDYHDVYYWQAPDFLTESLFVDFLTEIVDAVSDRDTQRFLRLFQPSPELKDELVRLNQKRKRWFIGYEDDNACSLRVREVCSNFCRIGDFISIYPSQGSQSIKSIDVLVNKETDPSGELRRRINQTLAADVASYEESEAVEEPEDSEDVVVEDKYPSDEEEEIDDEVQANPEKPCYYSSQIEMASILKKRIDTIMWHYHKIAKLSDAFDDVDFTVYTARYRMLSDQTEKRICHPDAGVLSKKEREARNECNSKKRMFMYVRSAETDTHFEQLKQDVQRNPKTLFIIIADECHWGITKDREQKPSAHNLFINEWCKDNSPGNVVVVQISATPFNLLTTNSRLPEVQCLLLYDKISTMENKYKAGDLLVLEREPYLDENVKQTSKQVELHVVHWSEVELKNFERGMRMKLRSTLVFKEDAPRLYLSVSSQGNLFVSSDEHDSTEFIVQGRHGIVTIKAIVSKDQVLTITRDANGELKAKTDSPQPVMFEVKLDFGVGVAAFSCCDREDHYLAVDDSKHVTMQAAKVERKCGVSVMKPKHDVARVSFEFYIDQCGPAEVNVVGQQYLSLNYYLGTMTCNNKKDQKIREDDFFQGIVDNAKRRKLLKTDSSSFKIDALLCAEYCFHVVHVSVYDTDDKIRQALTSDVDQPLTSMFDRRLLSFMKQLKKDKRYIHPEAFELVRREICDKAKQDFKDSIREFVKIKKHKTSTEKEKEFKDLGEELMASFVACLMYLSQEDLQTIIQETRETAIIEEIKETLQKGDCQKLVDIWTSIVQESETSSLVKNLIQSGKGELGKMKIVRAKSMETANQFFHTLRLARAISSLEECFEIIRDYGGIQIEKQLMKSSSPFFVKLQPVDCQYKFDCCCSELTLQPGRKKCFNCKHVHKSITQYEDLENLACILILVDKGRMGDTFPHSFDCLDLRLNYDSSREFKEGSPLYLSTVIQELGRMCRYAKVSDGESRSQNAPYVLVGRVLYKRLEESLKKSPAMSAISCTRPDRYMITRRRNKGTVSSLLRWLDCEAHKDSYDHENKQTHCNRILLQAEPQIGKTGTYLCLIKLLRLEILGKGKVPSTTTTAFDEGAFYLHKQSDASEDVMVEEINERQDWQFPYWKTIKEATSLNDKTVVPGKYSIAGCFYTHDTEENPFILMSRVNLKPTKSAHHYQKTECADDMRACHWYHFQNCPECGRLLQGHDPVMETIKVEFDGKQIDVKCSLPVSSLQYSRLRKHLNSIRSTHGVNELTRTPVTDNVPTLQYWIFHPSHRDDPRKCLLNYKHVMQEENRAASYVQVAVVRSEKFQAYRSTWGKILAILQLPDELPNCELGPNEGGVGYARLFIQKTAFALKLEYVFVIDDNVAIMSKAVFSSGEQAVSSANVSRDDNGVMKMERCSFFKPLSHLQKIAEGKEIPPDCGKQLEPHPFKEQLEAQQFPLYSYTGPAKLFGDKQHESYGVLGLLRSIPRVLQPFNKAQVYAVMLLNVRSTVEKKVFYRPWPCWEDLRFNDDCDKAGLWVVKCNRYHFLKVQYNDWINNLALPNIFPWREDSVMEQGPFASQLTKELEERILLEHLRKVVEEAGPNKCFKGQIGYDRLEEREEELSPMQIVEKLEAHDGTEEAFENEVPVLIASYCASNRTTKNMMLLNSRFCATKEKIVFITSARDAIERWPQLMLETVPTHNGICFFSEMSDRNAQFSIWSAADPRRHRLRWILIEASFLPHFATNGREITTTSHAEEASPENGVVFTKQKPNANECTPCYYVKHSRNDRDNVTEPLDPNKPFRQSYGVTESRQAEPPLQGSHDTQKSLQRANEVERPPKDFVSVSTSFHDSPSERRKIEDYLIHREDRMTNEEEGNGGITADLNNEMTNTEKWASHNKMREATDEELGVKRKTKLIANQGDRKSEESGKSASKTYKTTSDLDMLRVSEKKIKKEKLKKESAHTRRSSTKDTETVLRNEQSKQKASTSQSKDDENNEVRDDSYDSSQTSATSVYSLEDEDMEMASSSEMYPVFTPLHQHTQAKTDDNSCTNAPINMSQENPTSGKISPSNIAYMTGTNSVTETIVDLWREYTKMKRSKEGDLTMEQVKDKLSHFTTNNLEMEDNQGYTALLKACSLPSISPHVMQYLIVTVKVKLNCYLPHTFDRNHKAATRLIPGMSPLSVAIQRSNSSCISTFMRRQTELDVRSVDEDGNTALHHCVLLISKGAFQKLFPLFRPLRWKEMRNRQGNSPLDIARTLMHGPPLKSRTKEQALKYILEEMESR